MESKQYNHYNPIEFALDDSFVGWVNHRNNHEFWNNWIAQHPEKSDVIHKARILVLSASAKEASLTANDIEQAWEKVHLRILETEDFLGEKDEEIIPESNIRPLWFRLTKMAIGATAILLIAAYFIQNSFKKEPENQLVTTKNGEKLQILLPDSTQILLNAGSTLKYPSQFSDTLRQVELTGEGFFQVKSDPKKPFVIISNNVRTRVVGTAFNIKAYPESNKIQVAVSEGKVNVETIPNDSTDAHIVSIKENQMASYDKSKLKLDISKFNKAEQIGWKEGILFLEKANFNTVVNTIEKWFDVQIILKHHPDSSWRFSGTFNNQSLEYILKTLSYPDQFSYRIQDKTVTIYSQ